MKIRALRVALPLFLITAVLPAWPQAPSTTRRVYAGVVDWKRKTIGTVILLEANGGNVTGWIRLGKFVPIEGGSLSDDGAEFSAAGNHYKIDERKGRITYSGPDGEGDRIISRLTSVSGRLVELAEGERFAGYDIMTLDMNGRNQRYTAEDPSLWKREGAPFETFHRLEELLRRQVTLWVSNDEAQSSAEVIEEPDGMDIPSKAPKQPKERK